MIPCYNEERTIKAVVTAVGACLDKIIVVDDGSDDRTPVLAEEAGAEVLRHPVSEGKGAALQTGWRRARQSGLSWALNLDGDGQHAAEDIPSFFRAAERTGARLVIGNRMNGVAQMPWVRQMVNRWMSRRLSIAAGRSLPDSQCGFRLMNLEAWAALSLVSRHFEIESEMLLTFIRAGYAVEFVPIRAIYKDEQSKIHPVRDTVRWFRWWRKASR